MSLLQDNDLFPFQKKSINFLNQNPNAMLWAFCGAGKTIMTLQSFLDRRQAGQVRKLLIVAPIRVIYAVWADEAKKWQRTKDLTFSLIHGGSDKMVSAFYTEADVYLINYEGLNWLADMVLTHGRLPWDMVVYDEVTYLKNSTSIRMVGCKKQHPKTYQIITKTGWRHVISRFRYTVGLTGTPATNGYADLHGQFTAMDNGYRLGKYVSHFRQDFLTSKPNGFGYYATDRDAQAISRQIKDITLSLGDGSNEIELPRVTYTNVDVKLGSSVMVKYKRAFKQAMLDKKDGDIIDINNMAGVYNKCLQIASGDVYVHDISEGEDQEYESWHKEKLKALDEIIEGAGGKPILVAYNFKSNGEQIFKRYCKKLRVVDFTLSKASDTKQIVQDWNNGDIDLLIAHPKSVSHGIDNLQQTGEIIVWYGATWNLEYYIQLNKRLDRQGGRKHVSIINIIAPETIEEQVQQDMQAKSLVQKNLVNQHTVKDKK